MTTKNHKLLKWELCWIPVEMAMTGFGLFLMLALELIEGGTYFLCFALVVSLVVRVTHYCSIRRQQCEESMH